jgi:hypothetical protein
VASEGGIIESAGEPESGFSRTFDDPATCSSRSLCFSSKFWVVPHRGQTDFIKSAGEPESEIGPKIGVADKKYCDFGPHW